MKVVIKSLGVLFLVSLPFSCQEQQRFQGGFSQDGQRTNHGNPEFEDLLRSGNTTPVQVLSLSGSFGLADDQALFKLDPGSGLAGFIGYLPQSETVPEGSFAQHSHNHLQGLWSELGFSGQDKLKLSEHGIVRPSEKLAFVNYERYYNSLLVEDSLIQVVYFKTPEGFKLREVRNMAFGEINLAIDELPGSLTDEDLQILSGVGTLKIKTQHPQIAVRSQPGEPYQFELSTKVYAFDPVADTHYSVVLGDRSGDLIEAFEHKWSAGVKIKANTYERSYILNDLTTRDMGYIFADGGLADRNGMIDTNARIIDLELRGKYTAVTDNGLALRNISALPDENGEVTLTNNDVDLAALNAYVAVNRVVDYTKQFLSDNQVPELVNGLGLRTNVNLRGSCNAFYNGSSINFYLAGNGCGNTALINEIVYHEWGHGLDDFTGSRRGILDGAFSEGIGDIVGMFITEDHVTGIGIERGSLGGVRDLENNVTYPPRSNQVHYAGQVIGGAFWDLRKNLMALRGRAGHNLAADLFFKHLLTTDTYLNSYRSIVTLNDDDGDPSTPSPEFCAINRAFAKRNLADFAGCIDPDKGFSVRIDSQNGQNLKIRASHPGAYLLIMCPGEVESCSRDSEGAIVFEKVEEVSRIFAKNIYSADQTAIVDIGNETTYTLFSVDENRDLIGFKTIEFTQNSEEI